MLLHGIRINIHKIKACLANLVVYLCRKKSFAASFMAFSGVISKMFTAEPRYIPLNPSAR